MSTLRESVGLLLRLREVLNDLKGVNTPTKLLNSNTFGWASAMLVSDHLDELAGIIGYDEEERFIKQFGAVGTPVDKNLLAVFPPGNTKYGRRSTD